VDDRDLIQDQKWVAAVVRVTVKLQLKRWGVQRVGHDDIDDIVDTVLMSFYCNKKRTPLALFDPARAKAKSYVIMLTRRRLTELVRKQDRRAELDEATAAKDASEDRTLDDPEAWAQYREAGQHISDRLASNASAVDRKIFQSAFVEHRSNPEIAAELQIPKSKVADRVFALRQKIEGWLAEINIFVKRGDS
jgi:RNA polymerase sigma factor (sigma-70 family)